MLKEKKIRTPKWFPGRKRKISREGKPLKKFKAQYAVPGNGIVVHGLYKDLPIGETVEVVFEGGKSIEAEVATRVAGGAIVRY